MPTPSKQMEDDTESPSNGDFGNLSQNISALLAPNSIENTTNLPLPGLTDNTASSGSMLWLAGAVPLGFVAAGFVGRALYNISHSVYNRVMKSGQHDLEKARKKAEFVEENHSVERQPFLPKFSVETGPSEENHHVEGELGTGIINPIAKPPRKEAPKIDSSSTTEQLAEVVVHEGQQGAEGQTTPLIFSENLQEATQQTNDTEMTWPSVTEASKDLSSSLSELSVTKKSVSNNDLHRGATS